MAVLPVKKEIDDVNADSGKTQSKNLLNQFWNLASLDDSMRITSVVNVITELKSSGKKADLDYTVQRLVKGLSSSRKAARQGYATALTHILKEFQNVTTDTILELMSKHLAVTGALKGHEERDNYFGQIFGFLAICKAKVAEDTTSSGVKSIMEKLVVLMKKKSYIQEICGKAICDVLSSINYDVFTEQVESTLKSILQKGWASCTPEELTILLTIENQFKTDLPKKYFRQHWNKSSLLHKDNYTNLSKVLMDTSNTAHPRVHILWDHITEHFVSDASVDEFQIFWKIVVEDGLLESTHKRKFLALNVMLKFLPKISSQQVNVILSAQLLRCIINSCQSKENYLFNAVKDVLRKIPEEVEKNNDANVKLCVIKRLVGSNGHICFDSITHVRTVEQLTIKMKSGFVEYFNWLKSVFVSGSTADEEDDDEQEEEEEAKEKNKMTKRTEKDITLCRGWVVGQLVILARCCKAQNEEELLIQISLFLFLHSFFVVVKRNKKETLLNEVPVQSISEATHVACQQKFLTVLNEITNIHWPVEQQERKLHTFGGLAQDGEFYAMKILQYAKHLLTLPKYVNLKDAWIPEVFESFNNTMDVMTDMNTESAETEHITKTKGTQLLFIHTTLQLFSNREEAVSILQELHTCYKKAEEKKKKKEKEPHWTEVLTEILLSFLAQSSHLLRQVVDMVFPSIAPHLTQEALEQLINAIKPKPKNEEDFDMIDSDEEEENSGETNKNGNDSPAKEDDEEGKDNDDEDYSSDSDDDEEDNDDSDMEIDDAFKTELKAALGDFAVNSDDSDSGDDDKDEQSDDEADVDMDTCDPKQLHAMDQALASVFKARKQKQLDKKKKKDMKQTVLHFKLRVLDLVEIFIRKQPKDPKILQFVEPLLDVIRASHGHTKELALFERTLGIFKNKLCHLHEYPSGSDLNSEQVHLQIERLIELAKTASSALFVNYITQGIVYLIRVLRGTPEIKGPSPLRTRSQRKRRETITQPIDEHIGCLDEKRIIKYYADALSEFMTKRSSHLQPSLFIEVIQRFPDIGWKIAPSLPQYLNTACNNFRKVKACEMLKLLFSKKTKNIADDLLQISAPLLKQVAQILESIRTDNTSLKARQIHDIVHLIGVFVKEVGKYEELRNKIEFDELKAIVENTIDSKVVSRSPSLQSYCKTIVIAIGSLWQTDNGLKKKKTTK